MDPHDYSWILAVSFILSCLNAYALGANDVGNAFATAVAAKTLTLRQACAIALFTEFGGGVLLGASVADTIKGNIIDTSLFTSNPALLMLAMMCALCGSSFLVLAATLKGFPVSSTHAIIGAIIGTGIAAFGVDTVDWGWTGVGKIVASWFISPFLSGFISAAIFLISKYTVLVKPNSYARALKVIPVFFFLTFLIVTFFILYDGAPDLNLKNENPGMIVGIVFGVGIVAAVFAYFYLVQVIRLRVEIRPQRPLYQDLLYFYFGRPHLPAYVGDDAALPLCGNEPEHAEPHHDEAPQPLIPEVSRSNSYGSTTDEPLAHGSVGGVNEAKPPQVDAAQKSWFGKALAAASSGMDKDIVSAESEAQAHMMSQATKFETRTEETYSFLQVLSCVSMSFAHGSNDVGNAVGPISAVWYIWQNAAVAGTKTDVPVWHLAIGGACINLGLLTLGWRVMKTLGNKLTYQSPSRGFCTEIGAILTVLTASKLGLPVSTTHAITGSSAFVGLASSGSAKTVNWRLLGWCFLSWIVTVPIAALISGLLFAMIVNSPRV
ncbi:phosphate transporter [Capsaspora owczarzaki ATCC 30864]|uniref:Phosphate transporter n=1 Tax=Capsaspora owczarzaki (strain ATCC 30864) TaxID=595528 RepID=A0A0D2W034_CAPO3|nr:phosphate transporter [Capsaspora owczarzaki ATCC 30864]KJE97512.1 phosphate transporter [Capsaspora owczarzaki ATCC 30864]|eukprot:XP_004343216.1 phosphate transporter [Capsaspora owczarzaki ATCC 30864]